MGFGKLALSAIKASSCEHTFWKLALFTPTNAQTRARSSTANKEVLQESRPSTEPEVGAEIEWEHPYVEPDVFKIVGKFVSHLIIFKCGHGAEQ